MLRLVSPRGLPANVGPAERAAARRYGVAVRAILLDGARLALDGAEIGEGFHPIESAGSESWRWTNGEAVLHLPGGAGARHLTVEITDWHRLLQPEELRAKCTGDLQPVIQESQLILDKERVAFLRDVDIRIARRVDWSNGILEILDQLKKGRGGVPMGTTRTERRGTVGNRHFKLGQTVNELDFFQDFRGGKVKFFQERSESCHHHRGAKALVRWEPFKVIRKFLSPNGRHFLDLP